MHDNGKDVLTAVVARKGRWMRAHQDRGLNFKVTMGNILTLTPALTIMKDEMNQAFQILDDSLREVERRGYIDCQK